MRKWPYWLRGGVGTALIVVVAFLLALLTDLKDGSLIDWLILVPLIPFAFGAMWFGGTMNMIMGLLAQSAVYFVIGSFLGFIYGLIKRRKAPDAEKALKTSDPLETDKQENT